MVNLRAQLFVLRHSLKRLGDRALKEIETKLRNQIRALKNQNTWIKLRNDDFINSLEEKLNPSTTKE